MRHLLALLLLTLALPLAGCAGTRLKPGVDAALGWSSEPGLSGPAAKLGLGEYDLNLSPFGSPDGDATPTPTAPAQPDPALVASLKDLAEKQAAAEQRLKGLDAQVAAGTLSPAAAQAIKDATGQASAAAASAQEADAKYQGLLGKLHDLEANAPKMPGWIPTDWTIPGLLAFALAWGKYLLSKKARAKVQAEIEAARADAMAHTKAAIEKFDALPDTATAAEVREAIAPPSA